MIVSLISYYIHHEVWDGIAYPFPNFNGATVDVLVWKDNSIPRFTGHLINYLCWDYTILVKGTLLKKLRHTSILISLLSLLSQLVLPSHCKWSSIETRYHSTTYCFVYYSGFNCTRTFIQSISHFYCTDLFLFQQRSILSFSALPIKFLLVSFFQLFMCLTYHVDAF